MTNSVFEFDSSGVDAGQINKVQEIDFVSVVSDDLDFDAGDIGVDFGSDDVDAYVDADDVADTVAANAMAENNGAAKLHKATDGKAADGMAADDVTFSAFSDWINKDFSERFDPSAFDQSESQDVKPSQSGTDEINTTLAEVGAENQEQAAQAQLVNHPTVTHPAVSQQQTDNESTQEPSADPFAAQEKEVANLSIKLAAAREQVKAVKKELDDAVELLISLQARTKVKPGSSSSGSESKETAGNSGQRGVSFRKSPELSIVGVEDCDDDDDAKDDSDDEVGGLYWESYYPEPDCEAESWEIAPTQILWDGIADSALPPIKGFGPKKQAALLERCPTIGSLEQLRAGAGIHSIKSFGEELAGEIENRLIDFLSLTRDAMVFNSANGGGAISGATDEVGVADDEVGIADDVGDDGSGGGEGEAIGEAIDESDHNPLMAENELPGEDTGEDTGELAGEDTGEDINQFAGGDTEWVDAETGGEVVRLNDESTSDGESTSNAWDDL